MYCNYSEKYNCNNNCIIIIKNKYICLKHFNMNYKKYLLKIQKIYKGYIVRKKLKNIFYILPRDIQNKILYYIRLPIYYKRYYKKIEKIIYNKCYYFLNINNNFEINYLIKSYELLNKYNKILSLNFLKYMYSVIYDFLLQLNNDLYLIINNYNIDFIYSDYINIENNIILINETYNFDNIFKAVYVLNNYIKLYETNYICKKYAIN